VGDSGELSLDEVAFACVEGDGAALDNALDRAFSMGENAVRILRVVQSHLMRLHLVTGLLADGAGMDQATSQLRPPLFFKIKDRFTAQARRQAPARLARALQRLMQTEAECKSGRGADPDLLCRQTLVGLSVFFRPR
jgi:DNA polymerase III subunit delta